MAAELLLLGVNVLCVDDTPDALELLAAVLGSSGATVVTCSTAEAALAKLRDMIFDVVVSDLAMPGMDGYDLAHELRRMEREDGGHITPTLAVSADATAASPKRRFADFQVYMQKPFDISRLISVVEQLKVADGGAVQAGSLKQWVANGSPPG